MIDDEDDLYNAISDVPNWEHADYAASLMGFGSKYHRLRCSKLTCYCCPSNKGIYHACPVCGNTDLARGLAGVATICSCGTWVLVCRAGPTCGPDIAGYIIPSPLYKDTMLGDDSI